MKINRSTTYYRPNEEKRLAAIAQHEKDLQHVKEAFGEGKGNYGSRQVKAVLAKQGIVISRRKIRRLMDELGLVSVYGKPKYTKPGTKNTGSNKSGVSNLLDRKFSGWSEKEVIVSDLTYVKVSGRWCYICVLIDLFNREVVGWSVGGNKTVDLVLHAFAAADVDWKRTMIFHTDRGMEFCAGKIDEFLDTHGIIRSLSRPGTPIDNAVSESFFKTVKKEFVRKREFPSLKNLEILFRDWVHWYNHIRSHSANDYKSPVHYRREQLAAPLKNAA